MNLKTFKFRFELLCVPYSTASKSLYNSRFWSVLSVICIFVLCTIKAETEKQTKDKDRLIQQSSKTFTMLKSWKTSIWLWINVWINILSQPRHGLLFFFLENNSNLIWNASSVLTGCEFEASVGCLSLCHLGAAYLWPTSFGYKSQGGNRFETIES